MSMWFDSVRAELTDRNGKIRPVSICSLLGRGEFFQRLEEMQERLKQADPDESWQQFYDRDTRLQFLVQRCLDLSGIDPDWVTLDQVEGLLFHRLEGGEYREGWLVELNRPKAKHPQPAVKPMSEAELLAALASHAGLSEAFKLASEVPAPILLDVLEAIAEQAKQADPEAKRKAQNEYLKQNFDKLINLAGPEVPIGS